MTRASSDDNDLLSQCLARTPEGELAAIGGSELSRHALTLLRLLDGTTPLQTFANHLKRYDVAALADELLAAGFIAVADTPGRGHRDIGRWNLGHLFTGLRRKGGAAATETTTTTEPAETLDAPPPAQTAEGEAHETDDADLTLRLMNRYAPGLKDDADIDRAFRARQDRNED